MNKSHLFGAVCIYVFSLLVPIPSQAELIDNGSGFIYDDVLDITWHQPKILGDTWDDASEWAAGLTLGDATEWRLPYISVAAGAGPTTDQPVDCANATEEECRDNELGYMFYINLSGTEGNPILDSGDPDLALFPRLNNDPYWSETRWDSSFAWAFLFFDGTQFGVADNFVYTGWAVHEGNILPVPTAKESWGTIKAMYK